MLNMLYYLLSIMVDETQKGRDNSISHHCLIKLLVEKSLHDVSKITWEELINIDQIRLENLQYRVLPQSCRYSRRLSTAEATPSASTFGEIPSVNPPTTKETIEISSFGIEHSNKESFSLDSNDDVPLGILIKNREQKREEEIRKGKSKKKPIEKKKYQALRTERLTLFIL